MRRIDRLRRKQRVDMGFEIFVEVSVIVVGQGVIALDRDTFAGEFREDLFAEALASLPRKEYLEAHPAEARVTQPVTIAEQALPPLPPSLPRHSREVTALDGLKTPLEEASRQLARKLSSKRHCRTLAGPFGAGRDLMVNL